MSRHSVSRRRRAAAASWRPGCDDEGEETQDEAEGQDEGLRERVMEVEGWYRLLQADHASLQEECRRSARRTTELQAEVNRLGADNEQLQHALAARPERSTPGEPTTMTRMIRFVQGVRGNRWAVAAIVAVGTLLARDPAVGQLAATGAARVRQAFERDGGRADNGFVRFAAMIHARDQLDEARRRYNAEEAGLKGDALLEAQDRLRAAKARYREARLAFLPELARQCDRTGLPLPAEAARGLDELRRDERP